RYEHRHHHDHEHRRLPHRPGGSGAHDLHRHRLAPQGVRRAQGDGHPQWAALSGGRDPGADQRRPGIGYRSGAHAAARRPHPTLQRAAGALRQRRLAAARNRDFGVPRRRGSAAAGPADRRPRTGSGRPQGVGMNATGLQVSHVTKRFGSGDTEVVAVRDVSLDVAPGDVVLIMGPSGSGKTTLLLMLGALLKPTEGTITLNGQELSALSESRLPDIRLRQFGFIFQDFNLLSALNVQDNVALAAQLAGASRRAAREKAAALLSELGLGERLHFSPEKLS